MYQTLFRKNTHRLELRAINTRDQAQILSGQQLHAATYLARGFVSEADLGADKRLTLLADPHQLHAEYFIVVEAADSASIRAVARQIHLDAKKGFDSFPILSLAKIHSKHRKKILTYDPKKCVEISGLAKVKDESPLAALLLYREMWHKSVRDGDKLWLMACDVRLFGRLKTLFGSAITQIGDVTAYFGGDVVPAMLDLEQALPGIITSLQTASPLHRSIRLPLARFMIDQFPEIGIAPDQVQQLNRLKVTL